MKKKRIIICLSVILIFIIMLSIVGPYILLNQVRQEKVSPNYAYSKYFYNNYEEVRKHLKDRVKKLQEDGIKVETSKYAIDKKDKLYIDNIYLPAKKKKENLIVLTTGVHGMEGYIGSVMLDVFFEEVYQEIDTKNTGVLIVANVNPYGMKYKRRNNENNVDLNRNFILAREDFDEASNKDYDELKDFFQPKTKIKNVLWHEVGFYLNLGFVAVKHGANKVSDALLTGQYMYPRGVYYGGKSDEKSTSYLKGVFEECLESKYKNIVHIDIHSGYGPRYNMVIFNSVYEKLTEEESKKAFGYDYVIAYDSDSFYATIGDTTDYFYRLAESKKTKKKLYSTCFEFGTIGDSTLDTIKSLKYTIDENRQYWYPSDNKIAKEVVKENYNELFYPTEKAWREKAVKDFKTATEGVLKEKLKK